MRKIVSHRLMLFSLSFIFTSAQSQPEHSIYGITSINKGSSEWIALRKLDTRPGKFSNMFLNMNNKSTLFNNSVAAIAYQSKTNRLFYVAMNNDQLRYIDISSLTTHSVADQTFSNAGKYIFQSNSPITRLVIAPDDYGYTVTNGSDLIRFTTIGIPILSNMGKLKDDPLNNELSIHNPCSNQGGDMVADDAGYLYLITASNRVYKINIETRVASFLASISGLPAQFTTNGAAVNENGKIMISSSIYTEASFLVDPDTWEATPFGSDIQPYGIADLASSYVLHNKDQSIVFFNSFDQKSQITVFPNPVLYDRVNIQFNDLPPGKYTIELTGLLGKKVIQQKAIIKGNRQTEMIHIPIAMAQAFYYLRVLNEKSIVVSIQKLAVERR